MSFCCTALSQLGTFCGDIRNKWLVLELARPVKIGLYEPRARLVAHGELTMLSMGSGEPTT